MSMPLKAVIVDDESHGRQTLEKLLEWIDADVEVISTFGDPRKAIVYLNEKNVDLVFLDIEMPEVNGFELLSQIVKIDFDIIFTTAYDEFALQAFKVHAVDYLLKPIQEEELKEAIKQVKSKQSGKISENLLSVLSQNLNKEARLKKIAFPTSVGLEFIQRDQIIRCASEGNYTRIIVQNREPLLISKTLKLVEELIGDGDQFVRTHASHLVNLTFVAKYIKGSGGQLIMEDGIAIPVSKQRKSDLFDSFGL